MSSDHQNIRALVMKHPLHFGKGDAKFKVCKIQNDYIKPSTDLKKQIYCENSEMISR